MEDEPCDGCGAKPSKSEGHGSYTCKACYDERWCPKCRYALHKDHVCTTVEKHRENHIRHAILFLDIDNTNIALHLAEELTREEPHDQHFIPTCAWCGTQTGDQKDSSRFDHKPECKWKRFRQMVDPDEGRELGSS